MTSEQKIQKILEIVAKRVTPSELEKAQELKVVNKIINRIKSLRKNVKVMLCGSLSRDTHLRGERDFDIFVLFEDTVPREQFEKEGIKIGLEALSGYEHWLEYSEHPYVKGIVDGYEVEIVPCYKVSKASELKSAVDRSPFHARFLKRRLKPEQKKEVRLLKAFMKGIGCYGADISKEGFSGYLVELLILKYGTFLNCIKAASTWKPETRIALDEKHLKKCKAVGSLVFPDPTDPKRNVASAVNIEQLARFVVASRIFLKRPSTRFFFGRKAKKYDVKYVAKLAKKRQLVAIKITLNSLEARDTILGQLKRFKKLAANWLVRNGFVLLSDGIIDLEERIYCIIEVEESKLSDLKKIVGPPVFDEKNVLAFLKKHKNIVSGPRIENDRLVIIEHVKGREAILTLKSLALFLAKRGKDPLKTLLKSSRIMKNKEILLECKEPEFAAALGNFLEGKEVFF
ncbi:MAG: CCA tRNA nucleotidyltransferase [Candidatus Diapherotrites archaeon]